MNNSEKFSNYKTMTMYVCNPDLNKKVAMIQARY